MYTIQMQTHKPYEIIINDGILKNVGDYIGQVYEGKKVYIITDERVAALHLEALKRGLGTYRYETVIIEGYEKSKNLKIYQFICQQLLEKNITRGDLLIAFGGGVIGDLVGFVAATLYRGVPFIQIPTSLLAQVDSSIGGKTGIDFLGQKNVIGAFNQPELVLIDPLVLKTLPERELKNGFGEIVKHALIYSPELFYRLESNGLAVNETLIYTNLLIKQHFVESDEFDTNERMKLNFGHTFGHVIELTKNCLHGEAILSGILCSLDFMQDLGQDVSAMKERVLALYQKCELNYSVIDYHELVDKVIHDKKNFSGVIQLVLLKKIGESYLYPWEVRYQ